MLKRLRDAGFTSRVLESADDVGGTWYWNRYPGARCDIPTIDYTYSFDPELEREWTWSEKYATQPEILRYAQFVANKYDLRSGISFETRVDHASWDDTAKRWHLRTNTGETITCRYYVMATGCLSVPKEPDVPGTERFAGDVYVTGRWPHHKVDFTGKRVAVIGTGSSGIQSIPLIAAEAAQLTIFQRTPNYSVPAHNGAVSAEKAAPLLADRDKYRHDAKYSLGGIPAERTTVLGSTATVEESRDRFEAAWAKGELFEILGIFADQATNPASNEIIAEMIREKIRGIVHDPETAELLCPKNHPFGTKRPCLDTNYYATYNLPHVRLVDLRTKPISTITETGIEFGGEALDVDAIVYATGFDAMTGAIVAVDIEGRNGVTLKDKWQHGPVTYLGLQVTDFPNFFTITGPGSPSVLSNMMVSIEQHVDWVVDTLEHMRSEHLDTIEPTPTAESGWVQHVNDYADITLFPTANSWYIGANVPGKPRVFLPYIGGVDRYRLTCEEVVARDFLGFTFTSSAGTTTNDGIVRRLQPDVNLVLEMMGEMNLPSMDTMSPADARMFSEMTGAMRPPGPEVGEIVDGTMPAADGSDIAYRLYRPATPGPHPMVAYFHGGGWVIGSHTSDDPLCRDLCVRANAIIVSVNYRHAPEHRFPAAADDGTTAVQWIAEHASALGGDPNRIAVAGWSAGANVAAVAAQQVRDMGGPVLCGQLLLTPVTDCVSTGSYQENAEGFLLTKALMDWFWNHYCDPADRMNPKASPLRGNLAGLPPTMVVTCEFDPLRDEGDAYAAALATAGVPVQHVRARGHIHTSLTMVDVILSGASYREQMGNALHGFLHG